ncbi:formyltransferase family protein [Candidatus Pelagibacter sp.]|nr:formyltransferase family protein [Candidatus Pelagibacter sp.]
MSKKKINISFFFNSLRGLKILTYLRKNVSLDIKKIFISKKFLKKEIVIFLKKEEIQFYYFENFTSKKLAKELEKVDLAITGGFPIILKEKLINKPKYGFINCHAGILPNYRGGSPLNWQIINNESQFGITVTKINSKIDRGNILGEKKFKLKSCYDINDLHRVANNNFPKLVEESINKILKGNKGKKQNEAKSKYYSQRTIENSKVILKEISFKNLKLMVRALQSPYPNVFFKYANKMISINNLFLSNLYLLPGEIIKKKNIIHFGCKDKTVKSYMNLK